MPERSLADLSQHAPAGALPLAGTSGYLIRRSEQVHNVIWAEELAGELTSPQYAVLAALAAWPGIDQRQLGKHASLDKSSIADIVSRLVSRHWIVRRRDATDGRRNLLELTAAAAIALDHLTPAARRVQERLLAPLDPSAQRILIDRLQSVARLDGTALSSGAEHPVALALNAPGHLIRRAQQVHTSLWAAEFGREVTGPQYATLYVVSHWQGINQRQLGELAALDKSTAADLITRLERRGWIRRERDPQDGRGKVAFMTPEGSAAYARLAPRVGGVQALVLEPLPERARARFVEALAHIAFAGDIPERAR